MESEIPFCVQHLNQADGLPPQGVRIGGTGRRQPNGEQAGQAIQPVEDTDRGANPRGRQGVVGVLGQIVLQDRLRRNRVFPVSFRAYARPIVPLPATSTQ